MFLVRTAFWLVLIVCLFPTDKNTQQELLGTAAATYQDLSAFCLRNPEACAKSKVAFEEFSEKAKFGAVMLTNFAKDSYRGASVESEAKPLIEKRVPAEPASYRPAPVKQTPVKPEVRGTLKRGDQESKGLWCKRPPAGC